jgi:AcrR family transcriptional regulator
MYTVRYTYGHGKGSAAAPTGGRGARERILKAATELFYGQGINVTGIEELAASAHVSKRTLHQHFASKDALVAAYLERVHEQGSTPVAQALVRAELSPRERLLAVFDPDIGGRSQAATVGTNEPMIGARSAATALIDLSLTRGPA